MFANNRLYNKILVEERLVQ